jgi:hypothetical protein
MSQFAEGGGMSSFEHDFEMDIGRGSPSDAEYQLEQDFEEALNGQSQALEAEADYVSESYSGLGNALYELAQNQYESEFEVDQKINGLFDELEYEYFWNPLKSLKKPLGNLVRTGIKFAGSQIPAFQALKGVTSLLRGDMRGLIGQLIKAGLGSALPGAGPMLPAVLSKLGFESAEDVRSREAWENVADVAREAYEHAAANINDEVDDPVQASRLASESFETAVRRVQSSPRRPRRGVRWDQSRSPGRRQRIVRVAPGDELLIRIERA